MTGRIKLHAAVIAMAGAFLTAKLVQRDANDDRSHWPAIEENIVLPPPEAAPILYSWLGRQVGADINWARALVYYGSSTIGESDFRYLERFIDTVMELDPKFKRVYDWAPDAVTWKAKRATVEEFRRSIRYMERAIEQFPADWQMRQRLALRYALDLEPKTDAERNRYRTRAAELLEEAARIPGARIEVGTLAATLRTKLGQRDRALASLEQLIAATDDEKARARLVQRYRDIAADSDAAKEMTEWLADFEKRRHDLFPYMPSDFFALLGAPPPARIDIESVAPIEDSAVAILMNEESESESESETGDGTP